MQSASLWAALLATLLADRLTAVGSELVVLQPSIGYVYPPQVLTAPPQPPQPPQHHGYFYGGSVPLAPITQLPPLPPLPPPVPSGSADGFPRSAECLLVASSQSSVSGDLRLSQAAPGSPLRVEGTVYGLGPGLHGFHVHRDPSTADDCKGAGPHFNPHNQTHGAPEAEARHAGDLGNIAADATGVADVDVAADLLSLEPDAEGYAVGRAFVVHEKADDLGLGGDAESLLTGNAGARLACCVIAQRA